MTDSFADLWNSTAPTKPVQPQKLGSAPILTPRRPQNDVFSLLSSAGSSAPNSRPITPSLASNSQNQKTAPKPVSRGSSGDAFSGLLSGSLAASSSSANMTIAERAAKVERERLEKLRSHQQTAQKQASAWAGLDALAKASVPTVAVHSAAESDVDNWGFGLAPVSKPASKATSPQPPQHDEDDWGLGDFASAQPTPSSQSLPPQTKSQQSKSPAIWDLDDFASSPVSHTPPKRSNTPGDFDFGDREDRLLDNDSDTDDDILGALSKPVDEIAKRSSPSSQSVRATPSPQPSRPTRDNQIHTKSISPPPHIIGQIVEMGFSPQQARTALAATDTGLDVQAALETLLSNGAGSERFSPPHDEPPEEPRRRPRPAARANLHPAGPIRDRVQDRETPSPPSTQLDRNLQEQADKLLAQASEIGLSVFNRANALWATGKVKVQKAYEERVVAAAGPSMVGSGTSGRPRWMQEDAADGAGAGRDQGYAQGGFSDDHSPPRSGRAGRAPVEAVQPPPPQAKAQVADLFSDEPMAYVSPFRRGRPKQSQLAPSPPKVSRAPSPIRLVQRQTVSASSSAISASAQYKAAGGEKFKLGQYAEAESAYTAAINALPTSHLLLVPLYNNRALTRLKTGDHAGAVDDSTTVVSLIGTDYHPAREAKVTRAEDGAGIDLGDGLVKAWKRRAEAFEGREKWAAAQKDWEALAAADWAGAKLRGEAVRGAGRCRRMATAGSGAGSAALTAPVAARPKPSAARRPPPRAAPSVSHEALSNLRKANNAAEAEDQARHELKDTVDARLVAWKGGKETNIRALIASLDSVLWTELGWQKVGMADLVTPSQVKIRYTKAIAKLHPDKLNSGNTTLEQRMIANGVFGALNEAWNAFKQ